METGLLNLHDEEHFAVPSLFCDQDILEGSEGCLLDMIHGDFSSYEISVSRNFDASDIWDTEHELNGDKAVLPVAVPMDGGFSKLEPHSKEDFQKMLTEWQEHLGSLRVPDTEDIVGMDMVMSEVISEEHLPDDIFEDDTESSISSRKHSSSLKQGQKSAVLDVTVKDEMYKLSSDSFVKCREQVDLSLAETENDMVKHEHLPDNIFEEETKPLISSRKHNVPLKMRKKSAVLDVTVKDEMNELSLDNFVKCVEQDDLCFAETENDMVKHEHLPDNIFEEETKPLISSGKHNISLKMGQKSAVLDVTIEDEFKRFSLDSFMKCEENDNLGLTVAEDDVVNASVEIAVSDTKMDVDDDCVDVETVSEQIPVLEAGDLTSLLEQFEASEAFNTNSSSKPSVLDTHLYAMATQQLIPSTPKNLNLTANPTAAPAKGNTSILSHQNIKDSLPKEVIDRIKACGRKKVIPVIPAMPNRRPGKTGTRMQDAGAALSRNKLLKIVSGGGSGESVQLDHDYCTVSANSMEVAPPLHSFYHSDASEYVADKTNILRENEEDTIRSNGKSCDEEKVYSRLPEYYMVLAPQRIVEKNDTKGIKEAVRDDECWGESNSKKDSGLESGEVSDASEDTTASPSDTVQHYSNNKCLSRDRTGKKPVTLKDVASKTSLLTSSGKNCSNVLSVNGRDYHIASSSVNGSKFASSSSETVCLKPGREMISVLKKCQIGNVPNTSGKHVAQSDSGGGHSPAVSEVAASKEDQQGPKKRKLNLQEYRSRVKELDRIRGSRENSCTSSPVPSPSHSYSVSGSTSTVENTDSVSQDGSCNASAVSAKPDTCSGGVSAGKDVGSFTCETALRPRMQSVEVQTVPDDEVPVGSDAKKHSQQEDEKERRGSHSRDRRKRWYRSRRASSSSSSGSSSCNSRRRHRSSHSRHRHRPSWRRSPAGWSNASSGSRSYSIWSRSPSSGSSKSCSSYSSHSRSRSRSSGAKSSRRSPGTSKRWHRMSQYDQYGRDRRKRDRNYAVSHGWRRSRSPQRGNWNNMAEDWQYNEHEKQRQVEERRVIYVGRIEEGTSKAELRRRFEVFGHIIDISLHFREHGDNYGFVTFAFKKDAYAALEHGNDDPNQPHYELCFGGRRVFCKTRYSDLDGLATRSDPLCSLSGEMRVGPPGISRGRSQNENSFDLLLREAQAKLHKRKA